MRLKHLNPNKEKTKVIKTTPNKITIGGLGPNAGQDKWAGPISWSTNGDHEFIVHHGD